MSFVVVVSKVNAIFFVAPINWLADFDQQKFKKNKEKSFLCYFNKVFGVEPKFDLKLLVKEFNLDKQECIVKVFGKHICGKYIYKIYPIFRKFIISNLLKFITNSDRQKMFEIISNVRL